MRVLVDGQPVPHLWAVGDVTGKLMLAHTAAAQGTVAVDNILGHTSDDRLPQHSSCHLSPTQKSVPLGLTETEAKATG